MTGCVVSVYGRVCWYLDGLLAQSLVQSPITVSTPVDVLVAIGSTVAVRVE